MRAVIALMMSARHVLLTVIARVTRARDTHAPAQTHHAEHGQHAATVMPMTVITAHLTGKGRKAEITIV